MSELFSVIVPVYNREHTLREAIDSVFEQTYRPIEIVIVDDGSTDATQQVISSLMQDAIKRDVAIKSFRTENNGAGAARNFGIKHAQGKYIQFLDSDDLLHPERLELVARCFTDDGADFVHTGFASFTGNINNVSYNHYGRETESIYSQALIGVMWANTLRGAFTAELISKTGPWREEMRCFEDYEFVIRALRCAQKPAVLRKVLAYARREGDFRVSDQSRTKIGRQMRIKCEKQVARLATDKVNEVSNADLAAFSARLLALAVRSRCSGWNDESRDCAQISHRISRWPKNLKHFKWMIIFKLGWVGDLAYQTFSKGKVT